MKTWNFICGWKKTAFPIEMLINPRSKLLASLRRSLTFLFLATQLSNAKAAEEETNDQTGSLSPDIELLEFLGSFETDNGEWVEPGSLLTEEFVDLLNLAARMDAISSGSNNSENNDDNQQDGQ